MSAIPISSAMLVGQEYGFTTPLAESSGWVKRYGEQEVSQCRSAQMIAEKWDISREYVERLAYTSHQRVVVAIDQGRFKSEIEPFGGVDTDECPRRDTTLEKMAGVRPLTEGGPITAAVGSQIGDASSAMLVVSQRAVDEHGLTPRARIHHISVRGADPVRVLTGPIPATRRALEKTWRRPMSTGEGSHSVT